MDFDTIEDLDEDMVYALYSAEIEERDFLSYDTYSCRSYCHEGSPGRKSLCGEIKRNYRLGASVCHHCVTYHKDERNSYSNRYSYWYSNCR